jgi:hypothetical protein
MEGEYKRVFQTLFKRIYLLLDFGGLGIILLSVLVGMYFDKYDVIIHSIGTAIGAAILTIGISLPVATYYQSQENKSAFDNINNLNRNLFKIVNSCQASGINSIFVSRKKDSDNLRIAIEEAVKSTKEVFLLGVAFPSLFNPDYPHTENVKEKFHNNGIKMRILLLNPDSQAADRREKIERDNETTEQIKKSLSKGIVSITWERIKNILQNNEDLKDRIKPLFNENNRDEVANVFSENINIQIKLYDFDPIIFLMGFDECLFAEQYHFGRPKKIIQGFTCIGGYVPVIQYSNHSDSYAFFKSHFEYVWNNSKQYTQQIVSSAINKRWDDIGEILT